MSAPNPQPAPDTDLEPDSTSQLKLPTQESPAKGMPAKESPAKIDWRSSRWRAARMFSLLVLISAGLHGVAVLVPLPEQQEVIEKEEVLPEPIQVSTLPLDIPEEPPEAPEPLPVEPPPPPEPEPQIVIEQPIADPLPAALPENLLEDPPAEPPADPFEAQPDPQPESTPPKDPEPKPQDQEATRQAYNATGTSSRDGQTALASFITSPDFGGAFNLEFDDLKVVSASGGSAPLLTMSYPAEENSCFEGVESLSLPVGVAAIVGDFETDDSQITRAIIEAQIVRKTGYAVIDMWIESVVIGDIDIGSDIYEVIKNNSSEPLLDVGSPEELFSFGVIVELPDQPCD